MKKSLIYSALLTGLLAAGVASAQGSSSTNATAPSGEASTQTRAGEPNPTQRPDGTMPNSRSGVKSEARGQNRDTGNSNTPAGEASIVRNNEPNPAPRTMSGTTRSEVRVNTPRTRPQRGELGERTNVPTNPNNGKGTPE
ncbi:MAG: hypothetical protein JWQ03_872 [Variovorax sp.]|nr:hypothetical protein [Variovorax sp.]